MTAARHFLLSSIILALAACGSEQPRQAEVRPIRTTVVDPRPIEDDRQAVGEIRPRREADLGFRVAGKITARLADVGASVKKGSVLARLDEEDFRNRLKSAEADLASAEAVLTEATAAEGRLRQLLSSGTTTRANYDAALKNMRSAEAKRDAAKAAVELAKLQLTYAELRADTDGVITAVAAEPGQVVNTGQMVVRLANPDERDAVFAIAEAAFRGRPANDRPSIVVSLLSSPSVVTEGEVREISPVADPATRTYQVKVTLKEPPDLMRFGASVLGRLKANTAPVIVLPGSALFEKAGKPAVWVLNAERNAVSLRPVDLVRYETDRIVIAEGLAKGDVVVTAGVNRLREGQKVRVLAEQAQ